MINPRLEEDSARIAENIRVHDKIARKYDTRHGEIFNDIEQERLFEALKSAATFTKTTAKRLRALDYGCGSGNLTRHLLALDMEVVAADVSKGFLKLVDERFKDQAVSTYHLDGSSLPEASFDLIAVYSVLHHIPDYLGAIETLAKTCKPGGVILLDHEPTEAYWEEDSVFRKFRSEAHRFDWHKFLVPSNYVHKIRRLFNPRHANEGDIHVWPDDHIEWDKIVELLDKANFETVMAEDYLLYRSLYKEDVYRRYVGTCADMRVMAFRKRLP